MRKLFFLAVLCCLAFASNAQINSLINRTSCPIRVDQVCYMPPACNKLSTGQLLYLRAQYPNANAGMSPANGNRLPRMLGCTRLHGHLCRCSRPGTTATIGLYWLPAISCTIALHALHVSL